MTSDNRLKWVALAIVALPVAVFAIMWWVFAWLTGFAGGASDL